MIGILLAAGFSRRFGASNKLMHALPDKTPMALAAAQNLITALPLSIAVVRAENTALADMLRQAGLHIALCTEDEQVMADSLATAIRYAANFTEAEHGFVIALADMPYIKPASISAIAHAVSCGAGIAIPTFNGQRGHPVGFAAKFRNELAQVSGDEGARAVVKRHAHAVQLIACDDAGILADIDTPADLESLPQAS